MNDIENSIPLTEVIVIIGIAGLLWALWQIVARVRKRNKVDSSILPARPPNPITDRSRPEGPVHSPFKSMIDTERVINIKPNEGMSIFISYRRDDSREVAGRLYDRLVSDLGEGNIFKDIDTLPLGDDFRIHLEAAVTQASVVVAVIGPNWAGAVQGGGDRRIDDPRDFVRIEIATALHRGVPVIPVLVREAVMPAESELPVPLAALAFRNAVQVRFDPDFHTDVDRLVRGIRHLLARSEKAA